jgi:7-cyano-7-deazaguanine synthase
MKTETGAVILLSGGADSASLLSNILSWDMYDEDNVYALAFDYGQRHLGELAASEKIAAHYGIEHTVIQLPRIFAGAGSSLMGDMDLETSSIGTYEDLQAREGSQPTVVPFRNANLISLAVTFALTKSVNRVFIANHAGDSHNWHYPDCTPEFVGSMASAVFIGSDQLVRLEAPYTYMTKGDVVREGVVYGAPLHLTMTCYQGTSPACGECGSCRERIDAFQEAGVVDPIEYKVKIIWPSFCTPYQQSFIGMARSGS